jgi:hypothetical protein
MRKTFAVEVSNVLARYPQRNVALQIKPYRAATVAHMNHRSTNPPKSSRVARYLAGFDDLIDR